MYIDELAVEVEKRLAGNKGGALLLADDLLILVRSRHKLQEPLGVADWWAHRKDAEWSVSKCVYLSEGEGEGEPVGLDGQKVKRARAETYLGMMLGAEGLSTAKSEQRTIRADADVAILTNMRWRWTALQPRQLGLAGDAMVRAK